MEKEDIKVKLIKIKELLGKLKSVTSKFKKNEFIQNEIQL